MFWQFIKQYLVTEKGHHLNPQMNNLIGVLEEKAAAVCEQDDVEDKVNREDIVDCEQAEYDNAGYFVNQIDETLQDFISKPSPAKTSVLLGYLDLRSMFSTRVSQLFADQLCCAREAQSIKMRYMYGDVIKKFLKSLIFYCRTPLSQCIEDAMRKESKLESACITKLRELIEKRREEVLKLQLSQRWDAKLVYVYKMKKKDLV